MQGLSQNYLGYHFNLTQRRKAREGLSRWLFLASFAPLREILKALGVAVGLAVTLW